MPSFTRWAIATTHTPWQAITVRGSSGRLADLIVQLKSAGSGMPGRIQPAVAGPANAAATCLNRSGWVPARRCSRAPGLSCLRPRIRQGQLTHLATPAPSRDRPLSYQITAPRAGGSAIDLRSDDARKLDHSASEGTGICLVTAQPVPVLTYEIPEVIRHNRDKSHCPVREAPNGRTTTPKLNNLSMTGCRENSTVDGFYSIFRAFKVLHEALAIEKKNTRHPSLDIEACRITRQSFDLFRTYITARLAGVGDRLKRHRKSPLEELFLHFRTKFLQLNTGGSSE